MSITILIEFCSVYQSTSLPAPFVYFFGGMSRFSHFSYIPAAYDVAFVEGGAGRGNTDDDLCKEELKIAFLRMHISSWDDTTSHQPKCTSYGNPQTHLVEEGAKGDSHPGSYHYPYPSSIYCIHLIKKCNIILYLYIYRILHEYEGTPGCTHVTANKGEL